MNEVLREVLKGIGLILIGIVILNHVENILHAVVGNAIAAMQFLINQMIQCVASVMRWIGRQIGAMATSIFESIGAVLHRAIERLNLYWAYRRKGQKEFGSFDEFEKDNQEQKQQEKEAEDFKPKGKASGSAYEAALELLGLPLDRSITLLEAKQAYRRMASLVHPDKGFPNRAFMQQLNKAFAIIKREGKWHKGE